MQNSEPIFEHGIQSLVSDFDCIHNSFAAPANGTVLARQNPRRVYLAFINFAGPACRVTPSGFVTAASDGFYAGNADDRLEFWWAKHAVLVTMPWVVAGAALGNVVVYEVIWSPNRAK